MPQGDLGGRWRLAPAAAPGAASAAPRNRGHDGNTEGVGDIEAIVALVTSAYRGESSRAGWTTEADLLEGARIDAGVLRDDIEREGSRVLLAERDGRLLACAHVARDGDAGYFGMFSVEPGLQGAGIGSRLLAPAATERLSASMNALSL